LFEVLKMCAQILQRVQNERSEENLSWIHRRKREKRNWERL